MQIYTQCLRAPCLKEISPAHLSPRAMLPQAFPRKLLALLETAPAGAIAWSSDGASIVIGDRRLLVACLAEHFAHAQFASFQRQLHLYGFHKVAAEPDVYAHEHFSRARPQDVALVRRFFDATADRFTSLCRAFCPTIVRRLASKATNE